MNETEIRANFEESLEKLKTVHTREELDEVSREVYMWRDKLLAASDSFRRECEERQKLSKAKVTASLSEYDGRIHEVESRAEQAKRKAARFRIEPWMTDPRLREMNEMTYERLRIKAQGIKLVCPECGDPDRGEGNMMIIGKGKRKRKVPCCIKCNVQLIPERMLNIWKKNLKIKLRKKFTDEERRMGYGN